MTYVHAPKIKFTLNYIELDEKVFDRNLHNQKFSCKLPRTAERPKKGVWSYKVRFYTKYPVFNGCQNFHKRDVVLLQLKIHCNCNLDLTAFKLSI